MSDISDEAIRFILPPTLAAAPGYTHVVVAAPGRTVYIAGQVALDASGALVGAGDFDAQARQVFENLRAALSAAGAEFGDVVKITIYLRDMAHLPTLRAIRDAYVNTARPPASTAVQVSALARPEFLLEIEAIAVLSA